LAAVQKVVADARAALAAEGFGTDRVVVTPFLNLRYDGTDCALMTAGAPLLGSAQVEDVRAYAASFLATYEREFGFTLPSKRIVVDDVRARAVGGTKVRFGYGALTSGDRNGGVACGRWGVGCALKRCERLF
jgi:5-oxoprolinase (ATP-hydrolysing)